MNIRAPKAGIALALTLGLLFPVLAQAHVRLDNPRGGEAYVAGDIVDIQWNAYLFHGPGTIDLEFSEDGGVTYAPIVMDSPIPTPEGENFGGYLWTVPSVDSSACMVKVSYFILVMDSEVSYIDISPSFTIGSGGGGGEPDPDPGEGMPGDFAVTIPASRDNTLYEDPAGALSNGAGEYVFAGNNGMGDTRRGLIAFDIAATIPFGATITRVSLALNASKLASPDPQEITLIPMAADWGEGLSDAPLEEGMGTTASDGDATWIHTFSPSMFWDTPGGDFATTTAAAASIYNVGPQTFTSTLEMIDNVQSWLDSPETNWGWLLVGTESASATAVRFDTRENASMANQPALTIDYNLPSSNGLDSSGCLIATAAYGTPLAEDINTLRHFRDTHLLNNPLGTAFVDTYYRLSPPIADKVSTSPALSATIRLLLTPLLLLISLLTNWPTLMTLLLATTITAVALRRRYSLG